MSVHENPDELGYYSGEGYHGELVDDGAYTSDVYEECGECHGETFWRHPMFGPQPCLNCMGSGLVLHNCPPRTGNEGDGE